MNTENTTTANQNLFNSNENVSNEAAEDDSIENRTLISASQTAPFKEIYLKGINFDLVEEEGDTTYLATDDKNFKTPEGATVGTKFSNLPKTVQNKLVKESGWGYYCKLPSGWNLGFCEGTSCTDNHPKANSEVKWLFKRKQ